MLESILVGLAINLVSYISGKTTGKVKETFTDHQLKEVLQEAAVEFKACVPENSAGKDDKNLMVLFDEFFKDPQIMGELKLVFQGRSKEVDFDIMAGTFIGSYVQLDVETRNFQFPVFINSVIAGIRRLMANHEAFKDVIRAEQQEEMTNYAMEPGMEINLAEARRKYLLHIINRHRRLQFTGIPDFKEKREVLLPDVFVMQRAKESVTVPDYHRLTTGRLASGERPFPGDERELRRLAKLDDRENAAVVKFDRIRRESTSRRFVVLGKPGSGKSSLLKFFLVEAAEKMRTNPRDKEGLLFPLLVEIRGFEKALALSDDPGYNLMKYLYDAVSNQYSLTLPPGFFEAALESGAALVMFDGLDEVADEVRRDKIRQMIAAFAANCHPRDTIIVTSRISGYNRARFSTTRYRHFTLEEFNDEEMTEFVRRWYGCRVDNRMDAQTKAGDLKKALDRKPHLKELARNPLLLTIIGIIHRYEAELPEDRLILYHKATEALLHTWDNVKEIIDRNFKPQHKRRFLAKVAFHLQSMESGDEAGTVMERFRLYRILFPDFSRIFGCDNLGARELVDEFLNTIRDRSGLLVEQEPDKFGFVHKTFQEYFAACWMADRTILELDLKVMTGYVDQYLDNPFWREVLLLALRALPVPHARKVLDHILTHDPAGLEADFYHRGYFVMKFIAEQGSWLDDRDFAAEQIDRFFDFSWNDGKCRSKNSNKTWDRYKKWVPSVTDGLAVSLLSEKLLVFAEDESANQYLRRDCAKAVGQLGFKDKAAEILLRLAEDENMDDWGRQGCAEALGQLGLKNKAAEILLRLAEDENVAIFLRHRCIRDAGYLGIEDKAVDMLLRLAEDENVEIGIRRDCVYDVDYFGLKDKAVVERLLRLAENGKVDIELRWCCAQAAGNLSPDYNAMEFLLRLAEDENVEIKVRRDCVERVGWFGHEDKAVVKRLLRLAEDAKVEIHIRQQCACAAGELGLKDKAVESLLRLAEDEKIEIDMRKSLAYDIGNLCLKDKTMVERLLRLVEDENVAIEIRGQCADTVGESDLDDKTVVERLLRLAEDENAEIEIRRKCAYAVGQLGLNDKTAVDRLLCLAEDENAEVSFRGACAHVVAESSHKDKTVVERFLCLAEDEKVEKPFRRYCASVIAKSGIKDEAVVERLLRLVEDNKVEIALRREYLFAVGKSGIKDKTVVERLLRLVEDEKVEIFFRGSCAYVVGKLGLNDKTAVERLLRSAEDENLGILLRWACAHAVGNLGLKDKAVEILLRHAADEKMDINMRRDCAYSIGELGFKEKAVEILMRLAEDENIEIDMRRACARSVDRLLLDGKDMVVKLLGLTEYEGELLSMYEDSGDVLGKSGDKDKAVGILVQIYRNQRDKYSYEAREFYDFLWNETAIDSYVQLKEQSFDLLN